MKTLLVALGGNALLKKGEKASVERQFKNVSEVSEKIAPLAKKYKLVITHGNGPQVGASLIRVEQALGKTYSLPLEILVAETEAEIGYIIEQTLRNELRKNKICKSVGNILTQIIVNKNDSAFKHPTKFIGPFYKKPEADKLKRKKIQIKQDPRGDFRRVVASPNPVKIVESNIIKELSKHAIIIAAGGGGIPVYKKAGKLKGIEAVIDKDLASAVLASDIKASIFLILTDVKSVYLNFKKENQKAIKKMNTKLAKQYLKQEHFLDGSMKPKIQAAINFLQKNKTGKVIITSPEFLEKALKGKEGTLIIY
ncbi:MAG: carbamate kinase [Nanoarchaeota archaeon]|nr:carbamate kinase [Nanoarchaeota archaeon]